MSDSTPADILARHRPAMIGGQPVGCVVCLGSIPYPCDAVIAARLAETAIRWAVILDGRWAALREGTFGPHFIDQERDRLRREEAKREAIRRQEQQRGRRAG